MQRSVGDRVTVAPSFLRTVEARVSAPSGVQRLSGDDDQYEWQHRGAPPSESGARAAFGLAFLHPDADSTEGRALHGHDDDWAETFEATHAAALQARRDARYVDMVAEAERELRVRNLREERHGDEVLELERRDILALRRRLDDEMPWEFGPPSGLPHLYPDEPELPAEEEPAPSASAPAHTATSAPTSTPARTAPVAHDHPRRGRTHDAPSIRRDSAARRGPSGMRHAPARPGRCRSRWRAERRLAAARQHPARRRSRRSSARPSGASSVDA